MAILVSLLVALLGCFTYVLASNPKVSELGRIAYGAGLIAFCIEIGTHSIQFFK